MGSNPIPYNRVWDINTLSWVRMLQPFISTDTLNVTFEGVSTAAKQDTGNASLASIDSKLTNPLPVSAASLPLPTGAATSALQTQPGVDIGDVTINNGSGAAAVNIQDGGNSLTVDGVFFQATQPISAASLPLPSGASTEATLGTRLSESDFDTKTGALTETAPATDTASSGVNGRLQRVAQRLTSLIALLPAALVSGRLDVNIGASPATVPVSGTFFQATQPVSAVSLPLPTGAATAANQATEITSLANLDAALSSRLAEATFAGRINTQGQKTMAASTPIVIASDQSAVPITGSISANSSADVVGADGDAGYTVGDLAKNLTQTDDGRLRIAAAGKVSDARESYTDGEVKSLSLTPDGRLRVATSVSYSELEFFRAGTWLFDVPHMAKVEDRVNVDNNPWGF